MIEQQIDHLKTICECPVTALKHVVKSDTFPGFRNQQNFEELLGFDKVIADLVTEINVPAGKSLLITNIGHVLVSANPNIAELINEKLVFYWQVNDRRKTAATSLSAIFNGGCFLIFRPGDKVQLRVALLDRNLFPTFAAGQFKLAPRLSGFFIESYLTERLRPLETIYL
jgi:hypothetical protein